MENSAIESYLALLNAVRLSPSAFGRLLADFKTLANIRVLNSETLASYGLKNPHIEAISSADLHLKSNKSSEKLTKWAKSSENHIIPFEAPEYPSSLRQIPVPPPLLFGRGNLTALELPMLAIVGSRRSSGYGGQTALWMAHELARCGIAICSGLAKGIDGQAHRGALQAQGKTVAVVATGLDRVYPPGHTALAEQITEQGLLLSEFPMNTPARKENFPRRNRIISGLSLGVLIVEASLRSGSLITARLALEQNRDVFVVPGQICNEQSRGCHWLIKQGAQLVESPMEILDSYRQFGFVATPAQSPAASPAEGRATNAVQRKILHTIGSDQVLLDFLLAETEIPMAELAIELMTLEMEGVISAKGGRYFKSLDSIN